jgi:hypothetical protein
MGCGGSVPINNSIMDEIKEIEHSNVELYDQRPKPQDTVHLSVKASIIK